MKKIFNPKQLIKLCLVLKLLDRMKTIIPFSNNSLLHTYLHCHVIFFSLCFRRIAHCSQSIQGRDVHSCGLISWDWFALGLLTWIEELFLLNIYKIEPKQSITQTVDLQSRESSNPGYNVI